MVQDLFPASITQLPVAGLGDAAWHINLSHAGLKADWFWSVDGMPDSFQGKSLLSPPLTSRQMVEGRLAGLGSWSKSRYC